MGCGGTWCASKCVIGAADPLRKCQTVTWFSCWLVGWGWMFQWPTSDPWGLYSIFTYIYLKTNQLKCRQICHIYIYKMVWTMMRGETGVGPKRFGIFPPKSFEEMRIEFKSLEHLYIRIPMYIPWDWNIYRPLCHSCRFLGMSSPMETSGNPVLLRGVPQPTWRNVQVLIQVPGETTVMST